MKLTFNEFKGMVPKIDPALAAPGVARRVLNGRFSKGGFTPIAVDAEVIDFTDLNENVVGEISEANGGFYSSMASAWFFFSQPVTSGVDSLIAPQDEYSQIFFADDTGPRYMVSDQYEEDAVNLNRASYKIGVPFPETAPSAEVISDEGDEDSLRQRVAYIYTLVDDFGHEGPPSTPSNAVEIPVEEEFEVEVTLDQSATDLSDRPFSSDQALKRIYRVTQGTESAGYQYIGEVLLTVSTFSDTVEYGAEGELIVSSDWYAPPAEIKHIDAIASNFLAGFYDGNILAYSDVKLPHAWPLSTRYPLRSRIVKILSTDNGLFIGTEGKPYWAVGADPSAAIPVEMPEDFPCVSAESVVDMGGGVIYATHDGLVALNSQGGQIITSQLYDREGWQALDPYTLKCWSYEGRYLYYSSATNTTYALVPGDTGSLTELLMFYKVGENIDGVTRIIRNAKDDLTVLCFAANAQASTGTPLAKMVNGIPESAAFFSHSQLTPDTTFVFVRVLANKYPVVLQVNGVSDGGDETSIYLIVTSSSPTRIKRMPRFREWYVITGPGEQYSDAIIRQIDLCQAIQELT